MSVYNNMSFSNPHLTPHTSLKPQGSQPNRLIYKPTGKSYALNQANRRKFRANPNLWIQPSDKFYNRFTGRFTFRRAKAIKEYEKKLDNVIHNYTIKFNKYRENKKYQYGGKNYIIPSGHQAQNVTVQAKRKQLKEMVLLKQAELNDEADPNDPYAEQYAIDEIYEGEILTTMEEQLDITGAVYQGEYDMSNLGFIDDTDDEEGGSFLLDYDSGGELAFMKHLHYDNGKLDYSYEEDNFRCCWNYLKYYHNINEVRLEKILGKDDDGLSYNDLLKVAKKQKIPIMCLDLCYNVKIDGKGRPMCWYPKENERKHSKYMVFILANQHIYPFTEKTQKALLEDKLLSVEERKEGNAIKKKIINKRFIERTAQGRIVDNHTETDTSIKEKTEKQQERYNFIKDIKKEFITIISDPCEDVPTPSEGITATLNSSDFIDRVLSNNEEPVNYYITNDVDLNDIFVKLHKATGIIFKYQSQKGLITEIRNTLQDTEEENGKQIDTVEGGKTEYKFNIYCNTEATICNNVCSDYEMCFNNDKLTSIGKKIYNIDKKFKDLCSDYLEMPFTTNLPCNYTNSFNLVESDKTYVGVDINKCYSSLLQEPIFEDGFERFEIFDNIEPYDNDKKKNGWFYVEAEHKCGNFLIRKNDWYSYSLLLECDKRKFKYNITHQYYPHKCNVLKQDHFKDFVDDVYNKCGNDAKHVINSFIGQLGKHKKKKRCVKSIIVNNMTDCSYYTKVYGNVEILQLSDQLFMLDFSKIEDNRANALPIHNKIIEMGWVKIQELYDNLGGDIDKLVMIKTDMVLYQTTIEEICKNDKITLSDKRGEYKIEDFSKTAGVDYELKEINGNNMTLLQDEEQKEKDEETYANDLDYVDEDIKKELTPLESFNFNKKWFDIYIASLPISSQSWKQLQGQTGLGFQKWISESHEYNEARELELTKKYDPCKEESDPSEGITATSNSSDNIVRELNKLPRYKTIGYLDSDYEPLPFTYNFMKEWNECDLDTINNEGGFLTGNAGSGKSYQTVELIKTIKEKEKVLLTATTNKARANESFIKNGFNAITIHKAIGHMCFKYDKSYLWCRKLTHLIIDECSMIDKGIYYHLRNIKVLHPHLKIIFVGDYKQLPAVDYGAIYHDLEDTDFIKWLMGGNRKRLTKCMRTLKNGKEDKTMWNICKKILEDKPVDKCLSEQFKIKGDTILNISWTNAKKNKINAKVVNHLLSQKNIPVSELTYSNKSWSGKTGTVKKPIADKERRIYWGEYNGGKGCYIVATKNTAHYYNNQVFYIKEIGKEKTILLDAILLEEVEIDTKWLHKHFDYAYCITAHRSQGITIRHKYTIHEWDKVKWCGLWRNWRYVVLSRTSDISKVQIRRN